MTGWLPICVNTWTLKRYIKKSDKQIKMIQHEFRHGDDGYRYHRDIIADFSTNTWFKGPDPGLLNYLKEVIHTISHYPELQGESLTRQLADYHQLAPDQIAVTNGTAEAIFLIAQTFTGSSSRIIVPTFSEYEHGCQLFNHKLSFTRANTINQLDTIPEGLLWLCNPNNPTGQLYGKDLLKKLIKNNPQTIFIIDEAYSDFTLEQTSMVPDIPLFKNLVILKSLTKNHCLPGLRIGYLLAHQQLMTKIINFRPPWSVNTLALKAGEYLLEHPHIEIEDLLEYHALCRELQSEIKNINGFEVLPSSTGFFLVKTPYQAPVLKDTLVNEFGLLIRDASNFKSLSTNHIRIATLTKEKNILLVDALKKVSEMIRGC
ncbi:aminotransferase class I/II-fold pyridoxal phosphate-dependent enzyme [Marinilabiliaceae bacterium JC017]|nr:aminotransferase class I/II-fold pyridoxal phosphate-dependent enzyme [Marinilabiliaceae bacterium JC017]